MKRKTRSASKSRSARKPSPLRAKARSAAPARADALDAFIAASSKLLVLPARKSWLPTIKSNLRVTLEHAQAVDAFELPEDVEPAPVFKVQ